MGSAQLILFFSRRFFVVMTRGKAFKKSRPKIV